MNSFFNELLSYFIDMSINTYEEVFNSFPSQAIICTLKNFTDFNNIIIETNLENILDNDITKYLLNSNNYFKKNYLHKRIYCHLCQEYTYINKLYKSSDDLDCKILVKYYCSESHEDHCCTLIDFLFQCCKLEIDEWETTKSYRDGKKMKLSNEELILIKKDFKEIEKNIPKYNKNIYDKIIQNTTNFKVIIFNYTKL